MPNPTPSFHETLQRGDDRPLTVPSPTAAAGVDITGWPLRARGWASPHPGAAQVHEWSTAAGTAETDDGQLLLLCDGSRAWSWDRCYIEVELTHPGGEVTVEAVVMLVLSGRRA